MDWLKGKKTYVIASLMVLTSLVKLAVGDMTFTEFFSGNDVNTLLEGIGIGTLRAGISKAENK
jgi:hypothetical protein